MYVTLSDLHAHNWSAFSTTNKDGINSRLQIIIDEIHRAKNELIEEGGTLMILAGDLFHVRGKLPPTVFNPVLDCFEEVIKSGVRVCGISGNHDLESNEAEDLSSSMTALTKVGVEIFNKPNVIRHGPHQIAFIPYMNSVAELKETIVILKSGLGDPEITDLIIHAPVDGVIEGLPEHGLDPKWLGDAGYKRVFAGHYHNHVDFKNGVYSIGATTHQTWGDTNSKAGFLLVDEDKVTYRAARSPAFYTLDDEVKMEDVPLLVDGNYVRVRMEIEKESDVQAMKDFVMENGAKGVVVHVLKKSASVSRTGATTKSGESLESSIGEYIKLSTYDRIDDLFGLCSSILSDVEAV